MRTGLIMVVALPLALSMGALGGCSRDEERATAVPGGDASRGMKLLAQYQCGACHAIPGVPAARGTAGPSLDNFGLRSYIAGRVPNLPDRLASWIVNPPAMVPQTRMPAMGVSEADARHMAAYLHTLR